jgi:amino acid transporter
MNPEMSTDPNAASAEPSQTDADRSPMESPKGHGFGTMPVFLAGISTILGAIMFLRFGYAVGEVGLLGAIFIIILGHAVTIPTALALAEIATNRKVEGGGEYFIISRSFGKTIGGVIGLSLYLSQAISVAFYMIAFAEAFVVLEPYWKANLLLPYDPRFVSVPAALLLIALILKKGASLGVKALYFVCFTLVASLILFFLGQPVEGYIPAEQFSWTGAGTGGTAFFAVFAICFPAFTGMTAGVGLSGDLANPRKSIPQGTLAATLVGMLIYIAIVVKMAISAPAELLVEDQMVMARIALWGPMIYIGLAAATLSSAIGSILVAPRTLQALGGDRILPYPKLNDWLTQGVGVENEPRNATLITGGLALVIILLGNVNFVAGLISMFFMVTYGAICAISFLEHFAANPSYRPSFRSRWYVSLFGALACGFMMFQMDPLYAFLAIIGMGVLYTVFNRADQQTDDLAVMFQGAMNQATRTMQIGLQRRAQGPLQDWRPSVICVNPNTFKRSEPLHFMRWLCHRHGFGTYLHFIQGALDKPNQLVRVETKKRLLTMAKEQRSTVYVDTIVSPSMISALAQSLQMPGVSGLSNNTVLFEFSIHDPNEYVDHLADMCLFSSVTQMELLVLRHGDFHFGERKSIHIWLTWNDETNANYLILFSYILLGHPDWKRAEIKVFAAVPRAEIEKGQNQLHSLIHEGRLPISEKNVKFLAVDSKEQYAEEVASNSRDADLVVTGFSVDALREEGGAAFLKHEELNDVLFINAQRELVIE